MQTVWGNKTKFAHILQELCCPPLHWGLLQGMAQEDSHILQATPGNTAQQVARMFTLLTQTLFLFLADSHCRSLQEGPGNRGQGGKGSH